MPAEQSIHVEGFPLTASLMRRDRPWGHAIDVTLINADGSIRGQMVFACHPEFNGFDEAQAMTSEALMDIVRQRLAAAVAESASAFDHGITTLFGFNSPNDEWNPKIARASD